MQFQANKTNIHIVAKCGILACAALILSLVESMIPPPVAIPGIKLGLANVVTLATMYIMGPACTFFILLVRIILSAVFAGQAMSFLYSFCGGMMCYIATLGLRRFFAGNTVWALGVIGALCHNFGQLLCAYFVIGLSSIVYYGLVMGFCACITGTFTGICAQYLINKYNIINGGKQNDN